MTFSTIKRLEKAEEDGNGKKEEKTTDKTTDKTRDIILKILKNEPEITQKEIIERIEITVDGVRYHINKLKDEGLIKRISTIL